MPPARSFVFHSLIVGSPPQGTTSPIKLLGTFSPHHDFLLHVAVGRPHDGARHRSFLIAGLIAARRLAHMISFRCRRRFAHDNTGPTRGHGASPCALAAPAQLPPPALGPGAPLPPRVRLSILRRRAYCRRQRGGCQNRRALRMPHGALPAHGSCTGITSVGYGALASRTRDFFA